MLGLFVNTLTADDKYSRHNREKFPQHFQRQFYQKAKKFSDFFITFLISTSNFECFEKKDETHSLSIPEINDFETGGYLNI